MKKRRERGAVSFCNNKQKDKKEKKWAIGCHIVSSDMFVYPSMSVPIVACRPPSLPPSLFSCCSLFFCRPPSHPHTIYLSLTLSLSYLVFSTTTPTPTHIPRPLSPPLIPFLSFPPIKQFFFCLAQITFHPLRSSFPLLFYSFSASHFFTHWTLTHSYPDQSSSSLLLLFL